jgi:uncharacterized protein (TIGR02147 family)
LYLTGSTDNAWTFRELIDEGLPEELESSWLFYAALSAMELRDMDSSVEWMAKRLGADRDQMARILDLIENMGMLDRSAIPWRLRPERLSSGRGRRRLAVEKAHREYIDLARAFVTDPELADTLAASTPDHSKATADISGMTVSVDRHRLPEAMRMIREFRRSLAEFLGGGPDCMQNDEVYRLNVQLFPLTRSLTKKTSP